MTAALIQLRAKVDGFFEAVAERRPDELRCAAGCHACCVPDLSVCAVEAAAVEAALEGLDAPGLAALAERSEAPEPRERCVMLDASGRCVIYAARPLVCRSQGLPLRYSPGTLPPEAVRAEGPDAEVSWCPLNFEEAAPEADDVLDAERVDVMLALVNRSTAADPLERHGLLEIALRAIAR